jgi:uncharacterized repeat protein (TIGR03847 family)
MDPKTVKYPLGSPSTIIVETFGQPGKRTFRVVIESGAAKTDVWLEKEQLLQLGLYLQEAIRTISEEERSRESIPGETSWTGEDALVEFKARQMQLSYDVPANSFYLVAYEGEESEDDLASVSCWITPVQAQKLSEDSLTICASGRPPCFLCGSPIDPDGHVCPRANGHAVFESG